MKLLFINAKLYFKYGSRFFLNKQRKLWITKFGEAIKVKDMSDGHIENVIRNLRIGLLHQEDVYKDSTWTSCFTKEFIRKHGKAWLKIFKNEKNSRLQELKIKNITAEYYASKQNRR